MEWTADGAFVGWTAGGAFVEWIVGGASVEWVVDAASGESIAVTCVVSRTAAFEVCLGVASEACLGSALEVCLGVAFEVFLGVAFGECLEVYLDAELEAKTVVAAADDAVVEFGAVSVVVRIQQVKTKKLVF